MGKVVAILFVVALALGTLDRSALWMERRGWIYWRKRKPDRGAGGGGMAGLLTEFQQLVEPQVRHVIEDREERTAIHVDRAAGPRAKPDRSGGKPNGT
jgi:hypothetical protein